MCFERPNLHGSDVSWFHLNREQIECIFSIYKMKFHFLARLKYRSRFFLLCLSEMISELLDLEVLSMDSRFQFIDKLFLCYRNGPMKHSRKTSVQSFRLKFPDFRFMNGQAL